jgi:hypothetical protein
LASCCCPVAAEVVSVVTKLHELAFNVYNAVRLFLSRGAPFAVLLAPLGSMRTHKDVCSRLRTEDAGSTATHGLKDELNSLLINVRRGAAKVFMNLGLQSGIRIRFEPVAPPAMMHSRWFSGMTNCKTGRMRQKGKILDVIVAIGGHQVVTYLLPTWQCHSAWTAAQARSTLLGNGDMDIRK